uniref:Lipoprotein n=1 Tax=Parastrongyloides trichosuri TaxID=131310 RepID=A0A0N5A0S7_PARTI
MLILSIALYINLAFLTKVALSCGSFDCTPYSNNVLIKYEIQPSPNMTFSKLDTRLASQKKTKALLKTYLLSLGNEAVALSRAKVASNLQNMFTMTVALNNANTEYLEADIEKGNCATKSGTDVVVAKKDTYLVNKKGLVMKRAIAKKCTDGKVSSQKNSKVIIPLTFEFRVTIQTSNVMCTSHWTEVSKLLKTIIENTKSVITSGGTVSILS